MHAEPWGGDLYGSTIRYTTNYSVFNRQQCLRPLSSVQSVFDCLVAKCNFQVCVMCGRELVYWAVIFTVSAVGK